MDQDLYEQLEGSKAAYVTTNLEKFASFWELVSKEHAKGKFVYLLIKKLVEQLTTKPSKKKITEQRYKDAFTIRLVHTLQLVNQTFEFNASNVELLQKTIVHYRKMVRQSRHKYRRAADRIINKIEIRHVHKSKIVADILSDIVMQQPTEQISNFPAKSSPRPALTRAQFGYLRCEGNFSYGFIALKRSLAAHSMDIYEHLILLLKTNPANITRAPEQTCTSCLLLLHLALEFITLCPIAEVSVIKSLIAAVQAFIMWPRPYGSFARVLLEVLHRELSAPGTALRARLGSDALGLMDRSPTPKLLDLPRLLPNLSACRVNVFFDEMDAAANQQRRMLESVPSPKPNARAMARTLLLHLLEFDFEVDDETELHTERMEVESIAALTLEIEKVFAKQGHADPIVFADYRRQEVAKLVRSRCRDFAARRRRRFAPLRHTPASMEMVLDYFPFQDQAPLPARQVFCAGSYLATTIKMLFSKARKAAEYADKMTSQDDHDQKTAEVSHLGGAVNTVQLQATLCCVVLGDDRTMHRFLRAYVLLNKNLPEVCGRLDIRVFFVPTYSANEHSDPDQDEGTSSHVDMATFVARKDALYRKQVFTPFLESQILPPMHSDQSVRGDPHAKQPSLKTRLSESNPVRLQRLLLTDYIRGARSTIPFPVFECKCWIQSGKDRPSDAQIPFVISAELGLRVDIANRQKVEPYLRWAKSAFSLMASSQLCNMNTKLRVKYTQMDMYGSMRGGAFEEPKKYAVLSLRSVPYASDAKPSHPLLPTLGLGMVVADTDFQSQFVKPKLFKGGEDSIQSYSNKNGEHMQSVGTVEISCTSERRRFQVMLDGVVYGPFFRITISRHRTGITMTQLPVRTFVPMQ